MRQIALPLTPSSDTPARIVIGRNAALFDTLAQPSPWPFGTAILYGPPRAGKSLIARWFSETGLGEALDDADQMDETDVFHRWNHAQETGSPLLLVSGRRRGDGEGLWHVRLPDLASRLGAALELEIDTPDDETMAELLQLHAELRGLVLDDSATAYLVGRCERSHLGAERLVATIDRLSLERKQPPTLAIWRDALAELKGGEWGQLRLPLAKKAD